MKFFLIQSVTAAAGRPAVIVVTCLAMLAVYYRLAWPFLLLVLYLSYLFVSCCWTWLSSRTMTAWEKDRQENIFAGDTFKWEFGFSKRDGFPLVRCGLRFFLPTALSCEAATPLTYSSVEPEEQPYQASEPDLLPQFWNRGEIQYSWFPVGKELSAQLRLTARLRGYYYIPPVQFFAGDPSGLYQGINQAGRERYLAVLPRLTESGEIRNILSFAETQREYIFGLEDRTQHMGVRDYQQNDPLKTINWYATARTSTVKTNLYQRKDAVYCLVALDLTAGFQPVAEPNRERAGDPLLEKAISFACSLALEYLEQGAQTAFITNAPRVYWEEQKPVRSGVIGINKKRTRQIAFLNFADGFEQGQNILRLGAAIDDTGRAKASEQEKMWSQIRQIPPHTLVYLLCYHKPPLTWQGYEPHENGAALLNPADFYTPQRLAELPTARVHLLKLAKGGWSTC